LVLVAAQEQTEATRAHFLSLQLVVELVVHIMLAQAQQDHLVVLVVEVVLQVVADFLVEQELQDKVMLAEMVLLVVVLVMVALEVVAVLVL
jgi:hypothetical protein